MAAINWAPVKCQHSCSQLKQALGEWFIDFQATPSFGGEEPKMDRSDVICILFVVLIFLHELVVLQFDACVIVSIKVKYVFSELYLKGMCDQCIGDCKSHPFRPLNIPTSRDQQPSLARCDSPSLLSKRRFEKLGFCPTVF
jgi:hypothetical protein